MRSKILRFLAALMLSHLKVSIKDQWDLAYIEYTTTLRYFVTAQSILILLCIYRKSLKETRGSYSFFDA